MESIGEVLRDLKENAPEDYKALLEALAQLATEYLEQHPPKPFRFGGALESAIDWDYKYRVSYLGWGGIGSYTDPTI